MISFFFGISHFFTGLFPILLSYGVGFILLAGLLLIAFIPISFIPMGIRKIALWAAGMLGVALLAFSMGIKVEVDRHQAQQKGIDNVVETADRDAVKSATPIGVRDDPFNRKEY